MIHVATVHWKQERWIPIQHRHFERFMGEPYRVYSLLTGIDRRYHDDYYFSADTDFRTHSEKLNMLADIIGRHAESDDDLLLFIDGDALPVANVSRYARPRLDNYPLLAVQRLENLGDVQPHPCFCMTTIGFWKRIGGDWARGYSWKTSVGDWRTDVGGNLLGKLRTAGIKWLPMHRSNKTNLHPLLFGVYDDLVYHHGASFRAPLCYVDTKLIRDDVRGHLRLLKWIGGGYPRRWPLPAILPDRVYDGLTRLKAERVRQNEELSEQVFAWVESEPEFFQRFMTPSG